MKSDCQLEIQPSIKKNLTKFSETLIESEIPNNGMDTSLHFCDRYRKSIEYFNEGDCDVRM